MRDDCLFNCDIPRPTVETDLSAKMQRVEQLAIDIKLELLCRGITDPHGTCAFIPLKPRQIVLVDMARSIHAIHCPQMLGCTGSSPQ
jgi:hypothetical protein